MERYACTIAQDHYELHQAAPVFLSQQSHSLTRRFHVHTSARPREGLLRQSATPVRMVHTGVLSLTLRLPNAAQLGIDLGHTLLLGPPEFRIALCV